MKIFLNERPVEFVQVVPEVSSAADMVIEFDSAEQLKSSWEEFQRYEKYRTMVVVDKGFLPGKSSVAFETFISFFKFIPAAGGLVKNEKGEYLFIHRLGHWDLPKGKIEKKDSAVPDGSRDDSESARNAAIREVKEETGLKTIVVTGEILSTWHIYMAKERWILKRTRWFEMEADTGQALKPQASEGIFLVKWTNPSTIHCILAHTYASIRELLVNTLF